MTAIDSTVAARCRDRYVHSDISMMQLASEEGVARTSLMEIAKRGRWEQQRHKRQRSDITAAETHARRHALKWLRRELDTADKISIGIADAVDDHLTRKVRVVHDNTAGTAVEVAYSTVDADYILSLTKALDAVERLKRRILGVEEIADVTKQAVELRKIDIAARHLADKLNPGDDDDTGVIVLAARGDTLEPMEPADAAGG